MRSKSDARFYRKSVFKSAGGNRYFGESVRQGRCSGRRCEYVHVRLTKTSMFSTLPEQRPCLAPKVGCGIHTRCDRARGGGIFSARKRCLSEASSFSKEKIPPPRAQPAKAKSPNARLPTFRPEAPDNPPKAAG